MSKIYRYKDLSFSVGENEAVNFKVEFISDGNIGTTTITTPGPLDPIIYNTGSALLGTGRDLKDDSTVSFSVISNPAPLEDEIRIKYYINNKVILEHVNLKEVASQVHIILVIKFNVL